MKYDKTGKNVSSPSKLENSVSVTRKYLKEKLIIENKLSGYSEEKSQLLGILKRTVQNGESDSVLIIGPPGSGKSVLVSECLKEISLLEAGEDSIVVRLNGLIHTDDNLALREIIQTLHVEELEGDGISASFSDNLMFLLQSLRAGERDVTKPVVFVLDEFQLFCRHRNQTLLYNLFDVAQSAKAPLCVVGLTCRIDITEMLEKRVKSRFSHRQILLLPSPKFEDQSDLFVSYLSLGDSDGALLPLSPAYVNKWNQEITALLKVPRVVQLLRRQFELQYNHKKFKASLFQMVCQLSPENKSITPEIVESVLKMYDTDAKVQLLKDLSVLELCLVIAMYHQVEIYDNTAFNFEMVVNRYLKFAQQYAVPITERTILLKAFERIKDLELILAVSGAGKTFKKEYQLYNFVVTKSQVYEALNDYVGLPTEVFQWANSVT